MPRGVLGWVGAVGATVSVVAGWWLEAPAGVACGLAALCVAIAWTEKHYVGACADRGHWTALLPVVGMYAGFGIPAGVAGAMSGWSLVLPAMWMSIIVAVIASVVDVQRHRLPFELTAAFVSPYVAVYGIDASISGHWRPLVLALGCGLAVGLAALAVAVATGGQLGFGDVALLAGLGFVLGGRGPVPVGIGIGLGFLLAAVAALACGGRLSKRRGVALGPALFGGWFAVAVLHIA